MDDLLQVNSIVLDGSVSKDGRMSHWTSEHKRIIFATPQAFKNDVFKGRMITGLVPATCKGLHSWESRLTYPSSQAHVEGVQHHRDFTSAPEKQLIAPSLFARI